MSFVALACTLSLVVQDQSSQLVQEPLPDGSRLEYEVRIEADGNRVRHGSYAMLGANGKQRVLGSYRDGQKHGAWRYRQEDGKPWINGRFKDGLRSGHWEFRHANNKVEAEGEFIEGLPAGAWSFLDQSGEIDTERSGTYRSLHSQSQAAAFSYSGTTLDQALHGPWSFHWKHGAKMLEAHFVRGKRVGAWRFWHADGSPDAELLTREYARVQWLAGFFEEPIQSAGLADPLGVPQEGNAQAHDPFSLQALAPEGSSKDLEATYKKYRSSQADERLVQRDALIGSGPRVLPLVLSELQGLDLAKEEHLSTASYLIRDLLEPNFKGHLLLGASAEVSPEELRLALRRAHSIYLLTRNAPSWWTVDLAAKPHAKETASDTCPLLTPVFFDEALHHAQLMSGPYAARFETQRDLRASGGHGTQQPLAAALDWLARNQQADGRWIAQDRSYDLGVSGLALLALMGNGSSLDSGPHQAAIRDGVAWLMTNQEEKTGQFYSTSFAIDEKTGKPYRYIPLDSFYEHAIATQVMGELASMTPRESIHASLQSAILIIYAARNKYGAWGYHLPPNGESDSSMSGWMVAALTTARDAGLQVDQQALDDALTWFDDVTLVQTGRVGYRTPGGGSSRQADVNDHYPRDRAEALTAVGLWCRFLLGQEPGADNPMQQHAQLIRTRLPQWDYNLGLSNDLYYWYYGTYAMQRMGGKHWRAWNSTLKDEVLEAQAVVGDERGSWEPSGTWCHVGGRVYATAMLALCLESYFRYAPQLAQGD